MDRQFKTRLWLPSILRLLLCFAWTCIPATATGEDVQQKPNIVLVYADDVDCETVFGTFPQQETESIRFTNLKAMAEQGTRFTNFHVTTPVCGPSRACLYTGQYAHRNQCRVNDPEFIRSIGFSGGYSTFDPDNEMALWMKQAGYQTAHVGKYLHSGFYPNKKNGDLWKNVIPPGWDKFHVALGGRYFGFPSYDKTENQFLQSAGNEYRTDWDVRQATKMIQGHSIDDGPLLLCWSPIAAHIPRQGESMVAERHQSLHCDAELPEFAKRVAVIPKNQVEEMQKVMAPTKQQQAQLQDIYKNRLRALEALDEGIGALRSELKKRNMLENTIFIFTSDHGFRYSQHRHYGKRLPYDRITRVPFLVTGPGVPKNRKCNQLLANIDIAPTLVELAGAQQPATCDGKPFSKLMLNPEAHAELGRDGILIENWGQAVSHTSIVSATYSSMRTQNHIYTEWATGGREYFDLQIDPEQLHNLYPDLTTPQQEVLSEKMRQLRTADSKPRLSGTRYARDKRCSRVCGSVKPVNFYGYVESDAGSANIEIEIRCRNSGEYWSANGWSSSPSRVPAELRQPEGLISQWNFWLNTRQYAESKSNDLSTRDVTMSVIATDLLGRETVAHDAVEFSMAFQDPDTTVDTMHYDRTDSGLLTVAGKAGDVEQVTKVFIGLQDAETGRYWDGDQWADKYIQHQAVVTQADMSSENALSEWSFATPLPAVTRLVVIARAYNDQMNHDQTPAIKYVLMNTLE